jgi:histidine triad (HIT) family protein
MTTEPSVFTKIINRDIPATIIYEDTRAIAFFTIEPINYGHTLVVPKEPFANIFDSDDETLGYLMQVAARIGRALVEQKLASGINIIMNNGTDASQEVFHAHLHVVPRLKDDNALVPPRHITPEKSRIDAIAQQLQTALKPGA